MAKTLSKTTAGIRKVIEGFSPDELRNVKTNDLADKVPNFEAVKATVASELSRARKNAGIVKRGGGKVAGGGGVDLDSVFDLLDDVKAFKAKHKTNAQPIIDEVVGLLGRAGNMETLKRAIEHA